MKTTSRKYRNLVYVRLWWQLTPICITIFVASMAGYLALPDDPMGTTLAWVGILFLLAGILPLGYATRAYVQCRKKVLRLRYPLYTLNIPYENIESTHLTTVERLMVGQIEANRKRKPSWSERKFLEPLKNEHVIVVQFHKMPRTHAWLRLWIGRRWLGRSSVAVVVRDWLTLRREIDRRVEVVQADLRGRLTRTGWQ
jgi:hypothetical protein